MPRASGSLPDSVKRLSSQAYHTHNGNGVRVQVARRWSGLPACALAGQPPRRAKAAKARGRKRDRATCGGTRDDDRRGATPNSIFGKPAEKNKKVGGRLALWLWPSLPPRLPDDSDNLSDKDNLSLLHQTELVRK